MNLHVVFGSGQIGSRVAQQLLDAGHRVRVVSRHPSPPAGAESRAADARDAAAAAEAARGATVVYDCMNPPYPDWKRDLLALGRGSLAAARENQARLVALDCLYMYGAPDGPMTEDAPMRPCSKKGELRRELAELRLGARDVHVAIARASDFFGPALTASWWGERAMKRALAGKPIEIMGDPDQPHAYTYAEDVARALVALGTADEHPDGVWHVPTLPAQSTRALAASLGDALGRPVRVTAMSPLLVRAIGLFAPFMAELPEMAYQWRTPFELDARKFEARFGLHATPLAEQVRATAAYARSRSA
ncbi:MAG TPA: NAD-dependent epimerase/dehydratase family protein [Kofleriaceae bacterium]